MTTTEDVARLIQGAGDYDDAIRRCQDAGLAVQSSIGHILVGANIAVSQVGGNSRAKPYWIVYDTTSPEKSKVKVAGGTPSHADQTSQPATDRPGA